MEQIIKSVILNIIRLSYGIYGEGKTVILVYMGTTARLKTFISQLLKIEKSFLFIYFYMVIPYCH